MMYIFHTYIYHNTAEIIVGFFQINGCLPVLNRPNHSLPEQSCSYAHFLDFNINSPPILYFCNITEQTVIEDKQHALWLGLTAAELKRDRIEGI